MNNRHRRVARLKKQELNECGISTEKAVEAKKSFEMAATIYGLNPKEATEAVKGFKMAMYGMAEAAKSLAKIFKGKQEGKE